MAVSVKVLIPAKIAENTQTGCFDWIGFKSRDGYGIVHKGKKLLKAHRLAYCEANQVPLESIKGLCVRHKCDNPACINPDHLEIGTNADNTRDRHERNRDARGSKNGNARLTEQDVICIRSQYKPKSRQTGVIALAKKYQVSASLIDQVIRRTVWAHV
jgi:hypothetical protein